MVLTNIIISIFTEKVGLPNMVLASRVSGCLFGQPKP